VVRLPDRRGLPFQIFPRSYIAESRQLDFHLPDNRFTVKVVDRKTGRGVAGAEVEIESSFGEELSSVISTGDRTGGEGLLDLPPMNVGRLQLRVQAARYQEATSTLDISERDRGRPIRIELDRLPSGEEIAIELADGRPAAGAEAALFRSTTDSSLPWWQASADQEGRLELPRERAGSLLLIRNPAAGAVAIDALAIGERLRLPPRAPDLAITVQDRAGNPAPTTALALRLGGVEVAGRALSFLVGNPLPATDGFGVFRAAGLPAVRLEVLAWVDSLKGLALRGALSNLATPFDPVSAGGAFALTRIE
jgi:5-hydroxyisourate hydrolase-like protein (transthyretin family)